VDNESLCIAIYPRPRAHHIANPFLLWTCDLSTAHVWYIVFFLLFLKCIEWMITLRRQRVVCVSRGSCRRSLWAAAWWRQVSSVPLCPIYFIIHCPAYYEQPKDLLAFYLPCPWFTFWVTMVNYMLALYSNQRTWWELLYDTMFLFWMRWWYTCDI
jgi:hypothetical protein